MDEALQIVAGSVSVLVGVLLGRRWGRKELPPPPEKPSLICGCEHELSYHDLKTGECHETVMGDNVFRGGRWQNQRVRCRCRQYTGARPLETYWTPAIYTEGEGLT